MEHQIAIQNLKCGGCANSILKRLDGIAGISNTSVSVEDSLVTFDCQNKAHILQAEEALQSLGYPKVNTTNSIATKAKSFLSCGIGRMSN